MIKDNLKIYSFKPVIDNKCKVLILGSMPGGESLRKSEYYGYERNAFWKIMFDLLEVESTDCYDAKKHMLLKNNIALWDVIESCEREGSLDSAIKNIKANNFISLYEKYQGIKHVFFNGAKAYDTYKRLIGFDDLRSYVRLPSTSPAHAVKYKTKLDAWRKVIRIS